MAAEVYVSATANSWHFLYLNPRVVKIVDPILMQGKKALISPIHQSTRKQTSRECRFHRLSTAQHSKSQGEGRVSTSAHQATMLRRQQLFRSFSIPAEDRVPDPRRHPRGFALFHDDNDRLFGVLGVRADARQADLRERAEQESSSQRKRSRGQARRESMEVSICARSSRPTTSSSLLSS